MRPSEGPPALPLEHASGWVPGGWLGLVTAGALWTNLGYQDFAENINSLVGQIQKTVGDETDLLQESVEDVRLELQRLQSDDKKQATGLSSGDDDKCALPHVVPDPGDAIVVSDSMHILVDTVISPHSKRHCGFWGTGGIGKTTTSAWLCRQIPVRRHLSMIAWVALGQTPNIVACQRTLYTQLTGTELPLDISDDDKLDRLRSAFAGEDGLLVLDDVWELHHVEFFALIDGGVFRLTVVGSPK
eukprot:SAG31_NODE_7_length_42755_cov_130.245728_21_plen_244_part_00